MSAASAYLSRARTTLPDRRRTQGLSLIELILFIIIIAIVSTGIFSGFNRMLTASNAAGQISQASRLAQERMTLILPQRLRLGFAGFTTNTFDPCTAPPASTQAVCTSPPAGYTITTTLANNWLGNTAFKVVNVTVTGPDSAQVQALVADY